MEQPIRFIGLDVHKDAIVIAITAAGEAGKATAYGTITNTSTALQTLVKRLRQADPAPAQAGSGPIKFCSEAGPCGYGIHRTLSALVKTAWLSHHR